MPLGPRRLTCRLPVRARAGVWAPAMWPAPVPLPPLLTLRPAGGTKALVPRADRRPAIARRRESIVPPRKSRGSSIGGKLTAVLDVTGQGALSVFPTPVPISPAEAELPRRSCKIQGGDGKLSLNLLMPPEREVQTRRRGLGPGIAEKLRRCPLVPQIPDLHRLR
jgi:hypothetical protein